MVVLSIETSGCQPQTIVIGRRGTYETTQIAFDLSYLVEAYGSGVAVLAVKRSQDESAYPAVVTQENNTLTWTVSETDTAYVGAGECQLMWYVDGGLAKTIIYPMVVMRDILSTAEEPPDGYENWIEHLTGLGAETQQNAQNAAQSASEAKESEESAAESAQRAEDAAGMLVDVSATATTLEPGQPATAEYDEGVFKFGIPKGDKLTYTDLTEADKEDLVQGPIKAAQDAAVDAVGTAKTNAVDAVNGAGTTQVQNVNSAGATNVNAVNQAGETQVNTVNQAGATQVGNVNQAGATQVQAIEDKGDEVIDSIPSDYSDLTAEVDNLNRHLSDLEDTVSTTQIINTASGAIASFSDGADSMPIKKLVAQIEPVQAGSGDPSPDNVRPISGHTGAEIKHTGVNIWDEEYEQGTIDNITGELVSTTSMWRSKNIIPVKGGETYFFARVSDYNSLVYWYASDMTYLGYVDNTGNVARTAPANAAYARLRFFSDVINPVKGQFSVNYPATVTSYVPYTGTTIPITFPTTIYGGSDEVIGGALADDSVKVMLSEFSWRAGSNGLFYAFLDASQIALIKLPDSLTDCTIMCNKYKATSYGDRNDGFVIYTTWVGAPAGNIIYVNDVRFTTLDDFTASITDDYIIAKRATPVEYTLTPAELTTLLGQNNVWTDVGDVSVYYPADTKLYIDNKITTAIANALNA